MTKCKGRYSHGDGKGYRKIYWNRKEKTFKIAPFDIQQNPEGKLSYQTAGMEVPYMKGGSKLKSIRSESSI